MERNNIAFQYGIHRSPSAANDGELAECVNLEAHNGELTPSVMPEVVFTLPEGSKLLFVHTSGNYKNYIIQQGENLCWIADDDKEKVNDIGQLTPTSIHSVGNTLVVLTDESMEYILYKPSYYKRIGSKPPFCSISFGLQQTDIGYPHGDFLSQEFITSHDFDRANYGQQLIDDIISYTNNETGTLVFDLEEDYKNIEETGRESSTQNKNSFVLAMVAKMTESFHATVNSNKAVFSKMGVFTDSFFLRYAYRMYDGSHYMHSAPILFPLSIDGPGTTVRLPSVFGDIGTQVGITLSMPKQKLDYQIIGLYNEEGKIGNEALEDWSDVIKGLDVFVTKGIPSYNADSKVYGFTSEFKDSNNILYCGKFEEGRSSTSLPKGYTYSSYSELMNANRVSLILEKKDDEKFKKSIKGASLFYRVSSFNDVQSIIKDDGERKLLNIEENTLTNLEQQERLEDDYDSHNRIIPSFAHVYNGRLNVSGIQTKLFNGYPMESMVPYTYVNYETNYIWSSKIKIEIEGREIDVVSKSNIKLHELPAFIYYPSPKAQEFTLYMYNNEETPISSFLATFKAEVHQLLNGSFYLSDSFGVNDSYTLDLHAANPQPSGNPYISYPNKIYTSEVNNPFYFPLSGRNSIGTGNIIAITSNTKAISPGQFGQYPLIVFSTDGVWAMQIGNEGLYEAVHPISKDICVNPNILQTEGPVLFATHNGLHSVMAEQVTNLSKIMKGRPEVADIPQVDEYYSHLKDTATDETSFNEFIENAFFADDYINNRAVIYNPDKDYAYIYCLDCGMFSKMVITKDGVPVRMQNVVRAYPEVYMQSGSDIYTFLPDRDKIDGNIYKGVLITRTMVFGDPLAMKVVNDIRLIYRKSSAESRCRYAMYVSNDGYQWTRRTSLRGHSFKYFRFVIFTELADTDALQGMSVMFDYRRTNKLR